MTLRSRLPRRRCALASAAAAAGLLVLLGWSGCAPDSAKDLKVGVLTIQRTGTATGAAPREGAAGTAGQGAATAPAGVADRFGARGLELALEEINGAAGGGEPVRLVTATSDGDAQKAVAAFRKLVETERVPVVIAALTSSEVLACAPFANQSKTVLLTTMATSADVRTAGDYVFRNVASTEASAEVLAAASAGRFPQARGVIVYPSLEFGLSLRDGLQAALATRKVPAAAALAYVPRSDDTKAVVDRMAQAGAPLYFILGSGRDVVDIVKGARERGLKAQLILGGDLAPALLAEAGPAAEGAIAAVEGFDPEGGDPLTRSFVSAYNTRYGVPPSGFAAATYDAVRLVGSLMRKGATTGEALRAALYAERGFKGAGGAEVSFDADGESGMPPRLVEVRGGKLQPLR